MTNIRSLPLLHTAIAALSLTFGMHCCKAAAFEEYHTFTDASGRKIEAKVLGVDPATGKVGLQLGSGKKGVVIADQLSAEDRDYLKRWQAAQSFLSNQLLGIDVTFVQGSWRKDGRVDKRDDHFNISLVNHGSATLTNVYAEYCEYFRRKGRDEYIATLHHTFEIGDIALDKPFETRRETASYRTNESVGSRFRFLMEMNDGTLLTREIRVPDNLPDKTYPWLPDPASYPPAAMSEDEVRALAQRFMAIWADSDLEAWQELMRPMYPTSNLLIKDFFDPIAERIERIELMEIRDRNVRLEIESESGGTRTGWLMITPSGHVKYSPFRFTHPLVRMPDAVSYLVSSREDLRITGQAWLKNDKIPLIDYDINNPDTWEQSALQVLDWVRENGAHHDASDPRLFIPEEGLQELIAEAEEKLNRGLGR